MQDWEASARGPEVWPVLEARLPEREGSEEESEVMAGSEEAVGVQATIMAMLAAMAREAVKRVLSVPVEMPVAMVASVEE